MKSIDERSVSTRWAPEVSFIVDLVEENSRVLDLGCGEGDLLLALRDRKNARVEGIELSEHCIETCVSHGLFNVIHGDLDEGLADYADKSVDYVILTNTIQVLHRPLPLISECARVGKKSIISFPNFAHWPVRAQLMFRGRMPKSPQLPYEWYDSPNIHLTTIADFRDFCRRIGLRIVKELPLHTAPDSRSRVVTHLPNLLADVAIFVVESDDSAGSRSRA